MMARFETLKFWMPALLGGAYFSVLLVLGDLVVLHLIFGGAVVALFYLGEKPRPLVYIPLQRFYSYRPALEPVSSV